MPDIKIKNYSGDDVVYEDVEKIRLSAAEGGDKVPFTYGEAVSKVVVPDFSGGDMPVEIARGELVTELKIARPADLTPENIPEGKYIAGVGPGSFTGGADTANMPRLYAPTAISALATGSDGRKYFSVTNPYYYNGMFPRKVQILQAVTGGETMTVAEKTLDANSYTTTISFYADDFNQSLAICQPQARFLANGFISSDTFLSSNTFFSVSSLSYELSNITLTTQRAFAFNGDVLKFTLAPASGYYMPKNISVTGKAHLTENEIFPTYEYDPDNKLLTLTVDAYGYISIAAIAPHMPWLKNPVLSLNPTSNVLTVDYIDPNAEMTVIFSEGAELMTVEDKRAGMGGYEVTEKIDGAHYGFTLTNGYYKANCTGSYVSAVCRIDFDMVTAGTVNLYCYVNNVRYTYDQYFYGVVSNVDCPLSTSIMEDYTTAHSNVMWSSYNHGSASISKALSITMGAGKHFIYVKYCASNSNTSSAYFQFQVNTTAATKTTYSLSEIGFDDYGAHPLQVRSMAEGYTESDVVDIGEIIYSPVINNLDDVVSITNIIPPNVTAFELYIDDQLADTIDYDDTSVWSVALSNYPAEDVGVYHQIYVKGVGEGVSQNQSNIVESYLNFEEGAEA